MPARASRKVQVAAPAEVLSNLSLGWNGYTDPTLTNPRMWSYANNVFSGAFGNIQRARFAIVYTQNPSTGQPYTTLKYFALPGTGAWVIADQNGKLYSYDTNAGYTQVQRINPYVDPQGLGSAQLNGPWSREALGNILYEMNGQVKQAGRLANAATIEGWGLDTPDATAQVVITSGSSPALTGIQRQNGVVTAMAASLPAGVSSFTTVILNIANVSDTTFNGSFSMSVTGAGPYTFTYSQLGQNVSSFVSGNVTSSITKAAGRSYSWAWENNNKFHVGAPAPVTQYIQYTNQQGTVQLVEPGTVSASGTAVTGTGTFFTTAWIGRSLWVVGSGSVGRITAVSSATSLTLASPATFTGQQFQVYDPQATHIRLYATADGQATYLRIQRNAFQPSGGSLAAAGLQFQDFANAEPPNFPFTTETVQAQNVPPPIGQFVNEYQGRLVVYGVAGNPATFFYSNQESTLVGLPQESFAPLNSVTLPIQNATMNGMIEFPGAAVIWSDKQDMFRLTGLLVDNTVQAVASTQTTTQQGATIARLPYNLGCASPFAADITPLGGIWLTSNAEIWLFTDTYAPRNVGKPVQDILNSILPSRLNLCRAKYYHTNLRNWFVMAVPANAASFNNTLLVLDLDQLASNGSPSYFTFDMATNSPSWYVFQPGTVAGYGQDGFSTDPYNVGSFTARCDSLEVVYEAQGIVRLFTGQLDLLQDADYFHGGTGTEVLIPNATVTFHPWGNETPFVLKRPTWIRFNTNRDPSMLATDGWSFQVNGVDDDFYTFQNPLSLSLVPGVNDSSTLAGNPDFTGGLAFRHSPELYRIGGVNFVMGRRLQFQVNFPSGTGTNYTLRSIQLAFGVNAPS